MPLLFHIGLNYLGSGPGGKRAVESVLQQNNHDDFRISAGRYSGKPHVVVEAAINLPFVGFAKIMAHKLRRACLPSKVDSLEVSRAGCSTRSNPNPSISI